MATAMTVWVIDEEARLAALADTGLLDSPPDPRLDEIVAAASALCETPVALITLLDRDRQVFNARVGTDVEQTPIELAICVHALAGPGLLVIPDLASDERTASNPLVTGEPKVRFYAGAPLSTDAGHVLGTLCVLDLAPRQEGLTPAQARGLEQLAERTVNMIAQTLRAV